MRIFVAGFHHETNTFAPSVADWAGALTAAMAICATVLLLAERIRKLLGDSMVSAIEKLMGLVLTAVAVEMILAGLKRYFLNPL